MGTKKNTGAVANPYKRSSTQLAEERHMLSKVALANPGLSSKQLASLLSERLDRRVAPRTVRADLAVIRQRWVQDTKENFARMQAMELQRVTILEQEAWDAWRASQKPKIRETVEELARQLSEDEIAEKIRAAAQEATGEELAMDLFRDMISDAIEESISRNETSEMFVNKITTITEETPGDIRFLRMIHDIQQERRKIQGVYAPELQRLDIRKVEIQGYTGGWSPGDWLEKKDDDKNIVDGELLLEG